QAELRSETEKEAQSLQVFFIQTVVDIFGQIATQIRHGQPHLFRCFGADLIELEQSLRQRLLKVADHFWRGHSGRAAQTARTAGSPLRARHSSTMSYKYSVGIPGKPTDLPEHRSTPARSRSVYCSTLSARRSAGSPIKSAACDFCNIAGRSGSASINSGAIPHHFWHRMRTRACVLRELRSRAMRLTSRTGFVETSSRLRTARFEAID